MTPSRFREIVSAPGDTIPVNSKLSATGPLWTNATVHIVLKYETGKTFQETVTQTSKTIRGQYIVTTVQSQFYKQPMDAIMTYDEIASAYKVWALYGDTITEGHIVYDFDKKISAMNSAYGDGFTELGVGSYDDTQGSNRTLIFKNGILFCTRESKTTPVIKEKKPTMSWFTKIFKSDSGSVKHPEDVIRFYQQLGFFAGSDPATVIQRYTEDHGAPPKANKPWDDVFLLAYSEGDVWASDPEADVCADNEVYSEVLPQWARISRGAFAPSGLAEHWDSESGPITLNFDLGGRRASVSPSYQDDWIDLEALRQINALIASSGRQFECALDGNFVLVLCLTPDQKGTMLTQRKFPFVW